MHDAFISHASEDKADFVRPLAELLASWGLSIWFDEFSLRPGDSLSAAIDRGLRDSRFGVVVLSKAFFAKHWPDYELRGLISLEAERLSRIVPVWYGVSRSDVVAFSPTLADKVAVAANGVPVGQVAYELLATLQPDLHEHVTRYLMYRRTVSDAPVKSVPLSELSPGPVLRDVLPTPLLARIRLIHESFAKYLGATLEEMVDGFMRDLHPVDEIKAWEGMAAAFLQATGDREASVAERREIAAELLRMSLMASGDRSQGLANRRTERNAMQ